MTEVTLFGWLVATLASVASVLLLLVALGSVAFLGFTLISGLGSPRDRRLFSGVAVAAGVLVFVVSLAGLRVGGIIGTIAVSAALSGAIGAAIGCLAAIARGGLARLAAARAGRTAALHAAEVARLKVVDEGRRRFLEGRDLQAEVAEADASVERLRTAVAGLERVRSDLTAKLESASVSGAPSGSTGQVAEDYARLREEVAVKIDLGQRILEAAEAAAFRLACSEPLRRLLRRRPQEATFGLARAATAAELEALIDRCTGEIKTFLGEVAAARAALSALEARRPANASPSPLKESSEPGPVDPLDRARTEVDAVKEAYQAVLERTHVIRLRMATRSGMEEVASAAGAITERAKTMGLDESELQKLLQEVARAESAMSISAPDGADVRALTDALARSADALDRDDTASLDELLRAMREMD